MIVEDLNALHRTQDKTTWELTVELDDEGESVLSARVNALPNASVIGVSDRVFDRHDGGKIRSLPKTELQPPCCPQSGSTLKKIAYSTGTTSMVSTVPKARPNMMVTASPTQN